jgi:hypothetical protein
MAAPSNLALCADLYTPLSKNSCGCIAARHGVLLDGFHDSTKVVALLEASLKIKGNGFKWAIVIPELMNTEGIRQQEVIKAQLGPLNNVNQFMEVDFLRGEFGPDKVHVSESNTCPGHVRHRLKFRKAVLPDWRKGHGIAGYCESLIEQRGREIGGEAGET